MSRSWLHVALCALICGTAGLLVHAATSEFPDAGVWNVISFSALGACIGCLLNDNSDDSDFDEWH